MKKMIRVLVLAAVAFMTLNLTGCGTIESGDVGVKTHLGSVSKEIIQPGFYMRTPFVTSVDEYSAKEIPVELDKMTPKAHDNLTLSDLDMTVYYRVSPDRIPSLVTKYANQSAKFDSDRFWLPAYHLVDSLSRSATYDAVSKVDSLIVHTERQKIENEVKAAVQTQLNNSDPGTFTITRVVIRAVATDKSIENSIKAAVASQKQLEAMNTQVDIEKKKAEIRVVDAQGIAAAQKIIDSTLTREYLQHETNEALMKFAEKGSNTVIVPANMTTAPLINVPAK